MMQIIRTDLALELEQEYNYEFSFIPERATIGSAGYDVRACISEAIVIKPNETAKIPLGFMLHIDDMNIAAQVLPRSSFGGVQGGILSNCVGLIDSDYQNEWQAIIWNRNPINKLIITPGMRIAQMIFVPVIHPILEEVYIFDKVTIRKGGFGHTGEK